MKFTKRFPALVLCLVLLLGLATTALAAVDAGDYDAAGEKVQWLIDHDYVEGYTDGTLRLDQTISRAEFAAIMARAIGVTDAAPYASAAIFSDVAADDWYAGAVNFCFTWGAVAGMGDGTFAPEADVTATQAAKMILCGVCGLDAEEEGFLGLGWNLNVYLTADLMGLFEDVNTDDPSAAATRGDCFAMLYNALFYEEVVCENHGLAYVKEYSIEVLGLTGKGTTDDPYVCSLPYGQYTWESFGPVNEGAEVCVYEYMNPKTSTNIGDAEPVDVCTLDEKGEFFFVIVTDPDGVATFYRFEAAADYAFASLKGAVVVANEYASLLADPKTTGKDTTYPQTETGVTVVLYNGKEVKLAVSTDLNALGVAFDVETANADQGVYKVTSFGKSARAVETVVTDAKSYEKEARNVAGEYDYFVNFSAVRADEVREATLTEEKTDTRRNEKKDESKDEKKAGDRAALTEYLCTTTEVDGLKKGQTYFVDLKGKTIYADKAGKEVVNVELGNYVFAWFIKDHFEEIDTDASVSAKGLDSLDNDFYTGDMVKFIDNDGDGKYEYVLYLDFVMSEKADTAKDARVGGATTFGGTSFGGDAGNGVCITAVIDGVTYVTDAETETMFPKKNIDLTSEINGYATEQWMGDDGYTTLYTGINKAAYTAMRKAGYLQNDGSLNKTQSYTVYYDLFGNLAAAQVLGKGQYVLVSYVSCSGGKVQAPTITAELTFGSKTSKYYTVDFANKDADYFSFVRGFGFDGMFDTRTAFMNGDDEGTWTTLASWYETADSDVDYYLQSPTVGGFAAYLKDLAGQNLTSHKKLTDGVYYADDVEIYVVVGSEGKGAYELDSVKYYEGWKNIPAIWVRNIRDVYGVTSIDADGDVQIDVIVIECYSADTAACGFVFPTRETTKDVLFDAIESGIELDALSDQRYKGVYNGLGFYRVSGSSLAEYLPYDTSKYGPMYNTIEEPDGLYVSYWLEIIDASKGLFEFTFGFEDECFDNSPVVYAIRAAGTGFEAVRLSASGKDSYKKGDHIVAVSLDGRTSCYYRDVNDREYYDCFDYYIDLTASCDAAQQYFGYGRWLVDNMGDEVEDVWVSYDEDLKKAEEKFVQAMLEAYTDDEGKTVTWTDEFTAEGEEKLLWSGDRYAVITDPAEEAEEPEEPEDPGEEPEAEEPEDPGEEQEAEQPVGETEQSVEETEPS